MTMTDHRRVTTEALPRSSPIRTLVVEDELVTSLLLKEALVHRGHQVTTCEDAEEALRVHHEQPFQLLVLDWLLPAMDGLELCRQVRALPGGDAVAVMIITGRTQAGDLHRVLAAGANDYLAKPIDLSQFLTRIAIAEHWLHETLRRKHAEAQLLAAEQRSRALLQAIPDLMLRFSRQGELVDEAAPREGSLSQLLEAGTARGEIIARVAQLVSRSLGGDASWLSEFRLPQPGGALNLEARCVGCGPDEALVIVRDVTEKRQIEARLMLADRMVSLGTLAAGIAHEINNPLSYIIGNLIFLDEELGRLRPSLPSGQSDELGEVIAETRQGANRVRKIVHDLRSFCHTPEGEVRPVDVHRALEAAITLGSSEIRHRGVLVRRFGEVPPVLSDDSRLCQVFLNLLVNAAQALPDGSARQNRIEITTRAEAGHVVVEIRDNGVGMSPEIVGRIFDPFFTTKPPGVGTGLGLAIVQSIVTALRGELGVESRPGEGSCFRVSLPSCRGATLETSQPSTPAASPHPELSILLVDDDANVIAALRRLLQSWQVSSALSGGEALAICRSQRFDLILCDVMMPELSGVEVHQRLQQLRPDLEQRMFFMTGGASNPEVMGFLQGLSRPWLEKPFELRDIHRLVEWVQHPQPPTG